MIATIDRRTRTPQQRRLSLAFAVLALLLALAGTVPAGPALAAPAHAATGAQDRAGAFFLAAPACARADPAGSPCTHPGSVVSTSRIAVGCCVAAKGAIETTQGIARQGTSAAALAARTDVEEGAVLWRIGTTGKSNAAEAEFWSHEHPRSPGYAKRYGIPEANVRNADFIEAAVVPRGTAFVTREAPGVGANTGGGIEVVVRSGSARIALVLVSRAAMMGTSRDLYEESELLAVELDKRGETEAATRIRDAITGGSTSSEILFGLRWEFDRLLDRGVGGDAELAAWIADIRSGVAEALA